MCTTQSGNHNREDHFATLRDRLLNIWHRIDRRFHIKAKIGELVLLAQANPHIALVIGITCLVCALPVLGFAVFVLFTSVLGLMGFVFVEGVLVSLGAIILMCILVVLAAICVLSTGIVVVLYLLLKNGMNGPSEMLSQVMQVFQAANGRAEPHGDHIVVPGTEAPRAESPRPDVVGARDKPAEKRE